MNKDRLCKEIGQCFGEYYEQYGKYYIDNGDEVFTYKTQEDLLADWVDTLIYQHIASEGAVGANWEKEVRFIYYEVLKKNPVNVRSYGKKIVKYKAEVSARNTNTGGKMLYLGAYENIIDAIEQVWKYKNII